MLQSCWILQTQKNYDSDRENDNRIKQYELHNNGEKKEYVLHNFLLKKTVMWCTYTKFFSCGPADLAFTTL